MKAIMLEVPKKLLDQRRRVGADQWDEVWEGIIHMTPAPNRERQDVEGAMEAWLRMFWVPTCQGRVYHQINVSDREDWTTNYRIPDLLLLSPGQFEIDRNEFFLGAPLVTVEIHSPGDEAYEKLAFYGDLGVTEVWIVERDSRAIELFVLEAGRYEKQAVDEDGWKSSRATDVRLRNDGKQLTLQIKDDRETRRSIP